MATSDAANAKLLQLFSANNGTIEIVSSIEEDKLLHLNCMCVLIVCYI